MAAAVGRQALQRPEIGLPWERGGTGKREKMKRERGERKENEPHSRLSEATQAERTTRRQPRGHWLAPFLFTYALLTLSCQPSACLRKPLTHTGAPREPGLCDSPGVTPTGIYCTSSAAPGHRKSNSTSRRASAIATPFSNASPPSACKRA